MKLFFLLALKTRNPISLPRLVSFFFLLWFGVLLEKWQSSKAIKIQLPRISDTYTHTRVFLLHHTSFVAWKRSFQGLDMNQNKDCWSWNKWIIWQRDESRKNKFLLKKTKIESKLNFKAFQKGLSKDRVLFYGTLHTKTLVIVWFLAWWLSSWDVICGEPLTSLKSESDSIFKFINSVLLWLL